MAVVDALKGECVLVIDDEADVLKAVRALLVQVGAHVELAHDLVAAEASLQRARPTLLVVDFRLGEGNGIQALARLRALLGPVPAVLISGDTTDPQVRAAADASTAVAYKPLSGDRLIATLHALRAGGSADLPGQPVVSSQ